VLQASTALAAALALPRALRAQPAALKTEPLSDAMSVVLGPNANVLCADSADGVILVDGGHASWADALLATVERLHPGKPVRALFNTHWHEEQTGANRALGERGVEIVAQENTTLWLGAEVWVRWAAEKYPPRPKAALPTTSV
jgi:glyoxylase-like metal-dependent hydrolase (beta-lactamase superfamily II)